MNTTQRVTRLPIELYSLYVTTTSEKYKVFKATGLVKSLQVLIMIPGIDEDFF